MPPIGHMDWIGFRKLDPRPTLGLYRRW